MAASVSRRSRKGSGKWLLIGLLILLLAALPVAVIAMNSRNRKSKNYDIVAGTEYANYADWVVAQARHESADFTSKVYRTDNNPFGLKWYSDKVSMGTRGLQASDGGYYTHFKNDQVAFRAYVEWLRRNKHAGIVTGPLPTDLTTVYEFAKALHDRKYYTDSVSNYATALQRWLNKPIT